MLHFVRLIPSVFTYVRVLLHPNAGCEYVYALFFLPKRKFVQLRRSFYNACVISNPTDAYNFALGVHLLLRLRLFSNWCAGYKWAHAFLFLRMRIFYLLHCDICYHSVIVKFTETSPCTLRSCVSKGARVFFHRNACFKYACLSFFLQRSLQNLRIRMFWYACTFMKTTYPIDCTHMGIFSLRSGVSFNANACFKCPPTSYFCPFRMYFR